MAEDFNVDARITANTKAYVQAIDAAIKANIELGDAIGLSGRQIDAQDKKLNDVRKAVSGSTNDTRAQENAVKKQSRAWDQQNRIYDDYLKHQEKATAGTRGLTSATGDLEGNLIRGRYALYDVATSYAAVAAAALGAVTATTLFASRYETAFTEIERTTLTTAGQVSPTIENLRQDFLDLSEVMPLAFAELTEIGSLGAQLGIAEDDLVSFTTTVAQFSKLSGVSAEQTALAFGRIGELLNVSADEYVNLGAAIAANAVSAASTETQIISLTREIAAQAAGAGFTADQVVGLSSALASLGVAPEKARGALTLYFGTLNRAVAEGGQALEDFATVTGLTVEQLDKLVRNNEGGEVIERFVEGLSRLDNIDTTAALDRLNLSQLRVSDTFLRLGQNVEFVQDQFQIAEEAYANGTFLGDAYATVLDDVSSQFQLLLNSIARFLSTAGQPFLAFLSTALPLATSFFAVLSDIAASPLGGTIFGIIGALTTLIGVLAAIRGTAALAAASLFAISTASSILGGTGVIATLRGMSSALTGMGISANFASASTNGLTGSIARLSKGLGVFALVSAAFTGLVDVIFNGGRGISQTLNDTLGGFDRWGFGVLTSLGATRNQASEILAQIRRDLEITIGSLVGGPIGGIVQFFNTGGFGGPSGERGDRSRGGSFDDGTIAPPPTYGNPWEDATLGAEDYSGALDNVGSSAGGAGKQVRTLVDYASDLSSVFSRAFDIRFGSQLAVDEVADSWEKLADRIREAGIAIQGLEASRNIKEYFLSVAEAYGDELRAGALRAEIAEINEKIADTQADASTELQGNSKAARQNRKTVSDLAKGYQEYITALAAGGADQAELNAAVRASEREFRTQAAALGFADAELRPYIASFTDMQQIIARIPRNITVSANADPAIQAFREYEAAAKSAASAGRALGNIPVGNSKGARQKALEARIIALEAWIKQLARSGNGAGAISAAESIERIRNQLLSGNYASGGYTGRGGKYEPAGIVHKGEYVVPKSQVNQSTGMPYADALGRAPVGSRPSASYASGGLVNGGNIMVSLSPEDRKIMRSIGGTGDIVVAVDSMEIARASNNGNKQIVAMGGRPQ